MALTITLLSSGCCTGTRGNSLCCKPCFQACNIVLQRLICHQVCQMLFCHFLLELLSFAFIFKLQICCDSTVNCTKSVTDSKVDTKQSSSTILLVCLVRSDNIDSPSRSFFVRGYNWMCAWIKATRQDFLFGSNFCSFISSFHYPCHFFLVFWI